MAEVVDLRGSESHRERIRAALRARFPDVQEDHWPEENGWAARCPAHGAEREVVLFSPAGQPLGCTGLCSPEQILRAVDRGAVAPVGPVAPIWLEDFLLETIPAPRWIFAPYIQAETVCVLFSAPNVGKTLLAFHVLVQLAQRGRVLALEAEGSRGAFQRRLSRAALAVGGVPSKRLAVLHTGILSLLDVKHEGVIATWAKGYDCTMIDSLGLFTAGVDENDPVGMSLVGAALKRIREASGGAILALGHSVKTAWKPGEVPSLANLRGHSALAAMVDTALALVPSPDSEQEDGAVKFDLHVVKQRDEERTRPRRYTVDMRGDAATVEVQEIEPRSEVLRAELLLVIPAFPASISRNQLCEAVTGRRAAVLAQIRVLIDERVLREVGRGHLQRADGAT